MTKFGVIIAARMGSSRLPGKVIMPILGLPTIKLIIRRLSQSKLASSFILATTDLPEDNVLADIALEEGINVFRGDNNDVLNRYVEAAKGHDFDYCVRVTGDCPFIDGNTLDHVLEQCVEDNSYDLVTTKPAYPSGVDYEIYPKKVLEEINKLDVTAEEREHHLNYIYQHEDQYRIRRMSPPEGLKLDDTIFLLDTPEDYKNIGNMLKDVQDIFIAPAELIKMHNHEN